MRNDELPSPGTLRLSQKLRNTAASVIGAQEIRKDNGGTVDPKVVAFFRACAERVGAVVAGAASVLNGAALTVKNSAGANIGAGTAIVSNGQVASVNMPATVAGVSNGVKVNAGTVTGTGNFATFTVANGVITGITLSAS